MPSSLVTMNSAAACRLEMWLTFRLLPRKMHSAMITAMTTQETTVDSAIGIPFLPMGMVNTVASISSS